MNKDRITPQLVEDSAIQSFVSSFDYIFPGHATKIVSQQDLLDIWNRHKDKDAGRPKAILDLELSVVAAFLYADNESELPFACCCITVENDLDKNDLYFARAFSKVFNEDYARCQNKIQTQELWRTLRSTQFLRAIARISGFDSVDTSAWIQAMESSMALTYEGNPVQHIVVFLKKPSQMMLRMGKCYVPFHGKLSVEQALLGEKWIRAVVDGKRVALLGSKSNHGGIVGLVSLSALSIEPNPRLIAPHESLHSLQSILEGPDMALVASPGGSLFVLFGSGTTFQKLQGRWRYLNYLNLQKQLSKELADDVAWAVLRASVDLSFERKGALFCILNNSADVTEMVSDYRKVDQANRTLRDALRGLRITDWEHRQIIAAAASTDGATILNKGGHVLDIACMIQSPSQNRLITSGFQQARTFPGARSGAAWNASLLGISVKVSEDGPITIWKSGREIGRTG